MFYKVTEKGYILGIGKGVGSTPITKDEYDTIMSVIRSCPEAPDGYYYRLREDLTWELTESPYVPPEEDEAEVTDYENALKRLGV